MVEVIAICNQKGGVGKTTTAINLSACLAAAEKKTLLIDMDAQGNCTTGLGFDKRNTFPNIYQVVLGGATLRSASKETELGCLNLVSATPDLVGAELELASHVSRETMLKRSIESMGSGYDYVIIDCPPSLGLVTMNALVSANSVIIPVQCEYYAMEGMADLNRTISVIKERANPDLYVKGILLTMFDKRNNLSHQVSAEIRGHFPRAVFQTIIPRSVRLGEAPSHGRPIILYDINSPGSVSYMSLAQEIMTNAVSD